MKRLRILTFLVCLIPFVLLLLKVLQNDLGPDPAKELALETGEWSIRFLLLALAMTPLRHLSGRMEFAQRRRMVGLFALFYASVHFLVWVIFLLGLRWGAILEEVVERPYITIGFASFFDFDRPWCDIPQSNGSQARQELAPIASIGLCRWCFGNHTFGLDSPNRPLRGATLRCDISWAPRLEASFCTKQGAWATLNILEQKMFSLGS